METDRVIRQMNERLQPLEERLRSGMDGPKKPVLFVMGLPRSGTTLLTQMLIRHVQLGYVNNLIAKFWLAPGVGCHLVRALNSKAAAPLNLVLESEVGFTAGYDGPHEFGYFWQHWLPFSDSHFLDADQQAQVDRKGLRAEVALMESAWELPMVFKNAAALPLQTLFLAELFPTAFFLYIRRDLKDVARSFWRHRERYQGSPDGWYFIKPSGWQAVQGAALPEKIAVQLEWTQRALQEQFQILPAERQIVLSYENLCVDPESSLRRIKEALSKWGYDWTWRNRDFKPVTPTAYDWPADAGPLLDALQRRGLCE